MDTVVNTLTAGRQGEPRITKLASGGWVVVWQTDANSFDLRGQIYGANGNKSGGEFEVKSSAGIDAVSALPDGGFIVSYTQSGVDGPDVRAQRFNASGGPVGSQINVPSSDTGFQASSDVSVASDGSYIISWTVSANGQSDRSWLARYDAAGNKLGVDLDVTSFTGTNADWVALSNGRYAVTYIVGDEIRGRLIDISSAGAVQLGSAFLLNDPTLQYGYPTSLSIVPLADGGFATAWMTGEVTNGFNVTYGVGSRTFDANGARGSVTTVSEVSTYYDVSVAALASGYVVSWSGTPGTTGSTSYARAFDNSGDAIGGRFQVNTTAGAGGARIAGLDNGGFVAVFPSDEIRLQTFDAPTKLAGTAGDDTLSAISQSTPTQIDGLDGNDTLTGNILADELHGGNGADTINGGAGDDIISGDAGSDVLIGGSGNDTLFAAQAGIEKLYIRDVSFGMDRGSEVDTLSGGDGDDSLYAGIGDTVDGGSGVDALYYAARTASAGIVFDLTAGPQIVAGGTISGVEVIGLLEGSEYADTIVAGTATAPGYTFNGTYGTVYGYGGNDTITGGYYTPLLYGGDGNDTLIGVSSADTFIPSKLIGGSGADTITGGAGNDLLSSADGDEIPFFAYFNNFSSSPPVFDHGTEIDTLSGGAGDDDVMIGYGDNADGGSSTGFYGDTLVVSLKRAPTGMIADFTQSNWSFIGGTVTGFESVDWVEGSDFADTIRFGIGGPTGEQNVIALGGNDTVVAGYYTRFIDGGDGDDDIDARSSQYLSLVAGGAGNDTIRGGGLGSVIQGGAGNDTIIASGGFVHGGDGADTISGSGTLNSADIDAAGAILNDMGTERDRITGSTGNDDVAIGYGDDADGGAGTDTLQLSLGGASSGVTLGTASLLGSTLFTLGGGTIQNFETFARLRGTEFDDTITVDTTGNGQSVDGGAGNDTLISAAGVVTLTGGSGNDTFYLRNAADRVVEAAGGGNDIVYSAFTITTLNSANVETLILTGTGNVNATGTSTVANRLVGNAGNNILDGGGGGDRLEGGLGNDTYIVRSASDEIVEGDSAGTDTVMVISTVGGYTLGADAQVEKLAAASPSFAIALNLTGNAFSHDIQGNAGANVLVGGVGNDVLQGFAGNDTLDGGAGVDTLIGGAGDDVYIVDNAGDVVTELADGGIDEIRTTVANYQLAANVEKLTYIGTGSATLGGNAGNNSFTGGGSNDAIDVSQGGDDTVNGGGGNDSFFFGATFDANDRVDGGTGGNDQLGLRGDYTGANALTLSGANVTGVETVALLAGFDYSVTALDDLLTSGQTMTIFGGGLGVGDNFTFDGSAETTGKFLVYGGLGTDLLTGGGGNDGFSFAAGRFDTATDIINGGSGGDQVALNAFSGTISGANLISIETVVLLSGSNTILIADDWTLGGQSRTVFGAALTQGATIDGSAETNGNLALYGGSGNDVLTGGARNDLIIGGAGNDTIRGGLGADLLRGDGGADTFVLGSAAESTSITYDTLTGFDASADKIDLPTAITAIDGAITTGTLSSASFDGDLTTALAGLGANHAVSFTASQGDLAGHIFLIADTNGIAGYQAGEDAVFELVNPVQPITDTALFI